MNDLLSQYRYLLVPYFFHEVTSLHPPFKETIFPLVDLMFVHVS